MMKEVICTRNYYNDKGVLLAAKGTLISEHKLRDLNRLDTETNENGAAGKEMDLVIDRAGVFRNNHEYVNIPVLNRASSELIEVLSDSKLKPWSMHINALSSYLDCLYTHSVEVALVSLMIAIGLGYPPSDQLNLGLGAILHDVGKILIPRKILLKEADYGSGEDSIIRQHCELGWNSMSDSNLPDSSREIILQHHERLDGSGYPNQLKADQISNYSKIVMVADSFCRLTSGGSLREPGEVLREFRQQDRLFSKECLDQLCRLFTGDSKIC